MKIGDKLSFTFADVARAIISESPEVDYNGKYIAKFRGQLKLDGQLDLEQAFIEIERIK